MIGLELRSGRIMIVESKEYGDGPYVVFDGKKWVKDYIKVIGLSH